MDDLAKITILRNFTAREAELAETRDTTWSWEPGVVLFPEARCPYCSEIVVSNRIWKIGERQLLGRWVLRDGRIQKENELRLHPHVNGTSICMGYGNNGSTARTEDNRNTSELVALFMAINPSDCYWPEPAEIKAWLLDCFDHNCPSGCMRGGRAASAEEAAACRCDFHRIERGAIRCGSPCGRVTEPGAWHRHNCACGCGCYPRNPPTGRCHQGCGCSQCRCNAPVPERVTVLPEAEEEAEEDTCTHSCCRDCCLGNGCDMAEAWGDSSCSGCGCDCGVDCACELCDDCSCGVDE